jgi:hypothetical protein
MGEVLTPQEKDVQSAIKLILSELEVTARMLPETACHPYECDRRRKVVIQTFWKLYRRLQEPNANAG